MKTDNEERKSSLPFFYGNILYCEGNAHSGNEINRKQRLFSTKFLPTLKCQLVKLDYILDVQLSWKKSTI